MGRYRLAPLLCWGCNVGFRRFLPGSLLWRGDIFGFRQDTGEERVAGGPGVEVGRPTGQIAPHFVEAIAVDYQYVAVSGTAGSGDVVTDRGVDRPERPVMGNRFEESGRGNHVRLGDLLVGKRGEVLAERLMAHVKQFAVGEEDVGLHAMDSAARGDVAGEDRKPVVAVRTEHVLPVNDAAGFGIKAEQKDTAIEE